MADWKQLEREKIENWGASVCLSVRSIQAKPIKDLDCETVRLSLFLVIVYRWIEK